MYFLYYLYQKVIGNHKQNLSLSDSNNFELQKNRVIRGFAKLLRIRRFELVLANEPQSTCVLEAGSFGFKLRTFSGIRNFFGS